MRRLLVKSLRAIVAVGAFKLGLFATGSALACRLARLGLVALNDLAARIESARLVGLARAELAATPPTAPEPAE